MNKLASDIINLIELLEDAEMFKQADSLDRVLIKLAKRKLSHIELSNLIESKKMNLKCSELESILSDYGFQIHYSSKGHIIITHPSINSALTTSCHQHNNPDQYNPSKIHLLKRMIYEVAQLSPEYFQIEKEKPPYQNIIDEAKARAIAHGDWRFFEEQKRRN
jgi:hypothetical protein